MYPRAMPQVAEASQADEALFDYLKSVRQGYGLARLDRLTEIPRYVVDLLGIDRGLSSDRKAAALLVLISKELRALELNDGRTAGYARLGLNLSGDDALWLARAQARAERDRESRKTVERRVNDALRLVAVNLAARKATSEAPAEEKVALARLKRILDRREELKVVRFDVTVRVYADHVQVHEVIEVVSQSPEANYYVVAKTLPYRSSKVTTTVLEGARMLDVEQPNPHWLLELLEFPDPIPLGETHRFAVLHDAEAMAPMWTASAQHPMDSLTVRVWYVDEEPRATWLIDDFPSNLLRGDDIAPILERHAQPMAVDRFGNASHTFTDFVRDRTYGLGWTSPR